MGTFSAITGRAAPIPSLTVLRAELAAIAAMPDPNPRPGRSTWTPTLKLSKAKATEPGDFDTYRLTFDTMREYQSAAVRAWLDKYALAPAGHEIIGGRHTFQHVLDLWPREKVRNPDRYLFLLK